MGKNLRPPRHQPVHWKGEAHRLAVWRKFAAAKQRGRPSPGQRGYDAAWREVRNAHLQAEPNCRQCAMDGVARRAQLVDHIESIKARPDLRLDPGNLQSLCWPCHNAKTNRYDGGFGLPRR